MIAHSMMSRIIGVALLTALVSVVGSAPLAAQSQSGTITFEGGPDRAVIGTTIPGVTFSNTAGNPWLYGDVRTGRYNAPFPNNCPGFGGQCAYTVDGNGFAWMGNASGTGRIDFTGGPVGFVSAAFSTADQLTIEAYSATDALITSQSIAANLRTGGLDGAELAGEGIAYILIKGGQNRWLMDNLTIAASPRGPAKANQAQVTVVERIASPPTIAPGSRITLTIVATNRGRGIAKGVLITLPLDQAQARLDNAAFSRSGPWVSAISDAAVTIQTGGLAPAGDTVTATLTITVLGSASAGGAIGGPLAFAWRDEAGGGAGRSNSLGITVGGPAFSPALSVAEVGEDLRFSGAIFAPDEPVGIWYNTPDGKAVGLETIRADSRGQVTFTIAAGLPAGAYSAVAYGHWTEFTAVGEFSQP